MKSKIEFIADILRDKRLNGELRRRVVDIAFSEIKLKGTDLHSFDEHDPGGTPEIKEGTKKLKHDPIFVSKLLSKFRYDNIMKWTSHSWDTIEFNSMDDYFEGIQSHYSEYILLTQYCPNLYWELIFPFIFQKKLTTKKNSNGETNPFKWGINDLKMGWQYPQDLMKSWCEINFFNQPKKFRKLPFEMEIPKELRPENRINDISIKYFGEIADLFKKEIEFRENALYYSVKKLVKLELSDFVISQNDLDQLKNKEFYTYTTKVIDGIRAIFQMIKTRSEFLEIQIRVIIIEAFLTIEIVHINSFDYKTLDNKHKLLQGNSGKYGGDLGKVVSALHSLCGFEIESVFKDDRGNKIPSKVKFLYNSSNKICSFPIVERNLKHPVSGFTYRLIFPLHTQK